MGGVAKGYKYDPFLGLAFSRSSVFLVFRSMRSVYVGVLIYGEYGRSLLCVLLVSQLSTCGRLVHRRLVVDASRLSGRLASSRRCLLPVVERLTVSARCCRVFKSTCWRIITVRSRRRVTITATDSQSIAIQRLQHSPNLYYAGPSSRRVIFICFGRQVFYC